MTGILVMLMLGNSIAAEPPAECVELRPDPISGDSGWDRYRDTSWLAPLTTRVRSVVFGQPRPGDYRLAEPADVRWSVAPLSIEEYNGVCWTYPFHADEGEMVVGLFDPQPVRMVEAAGLILEQTWDALFREHGEFGRLVLLGRYVVGSSAFVDVFPRQPLPANSERAVREVCDALMAHPLPNPSLRPHFPVALRDFWSAASLADAELRTLYFDLVYGHKDALNDLANAFFARRYGAQPDARRSDDAAYLADFVSGPSALALYRWAMARSAARLGMPEAKDWARAAREDIANAADLEEQARYLADLDAIIAAPAGG